MGNQNSKDVERSCISSITTTILHGIKYSQEKVLLLLENLFKMNFSVVLELFQEIWSTLKNHIISNPSIVLHLYLLSCLIITIWEHGLDYIKEYNFRKDNVIEIIGRKDIGWSEKGSKVLLEISSLGISVCSKLIVNFITIIISPLKVAINFIADVSTFVSSFIYGIKDAFINHLNNNQPHN